MSSTPLLLAIDWGSSALRGALVTADGRVLQQRACARGMLGIAPDGFAPVFEEAFGDWMRQARLCLMSGMVGSRQGWREAPYCPCPARFEDLLPQLCWLVPGCHAIVPGLSLDACDPPDVMRGEEIQVFGALRLLGLASARVVHPGTHSKWVRVEDGRITHFSTWMTGEVYALLRHQSVLSRSLPTEEPPADAAAFEQGLRRALAEPALLHHVFGVRTLALFDRLPPAARASYLSGLLIGEELRAQQLQRGDTLVLVGAPPLTARYGQALAMLGVSPQVVGEAATWAGLHALAVALDAFKGARKAA